MDDFYRHKSGFVVILEGKRMASGHTGNVVPGKPGCEFESRALRCN
jgi:hypothetical protein